MKYLALKFGQLRQSHRPESTLILAVKQAYGICHLTGHMFRGVQWVGLNNMKMMSKNINIPLSIAYPNFCIGSELVPGTAVFSKFSLFHTC